MIAVASRWIAAAKALLLPLLGAAVVALAWAFSNERKRSEEIERWHETKEIADEIRDRPVTVGDKRSVLDRM